MLRAGTRLGISWLETAVEAVFSSMLARLQLSNIAVFPILADAVDVKRGDQVCETVSQPSIQPDKVVRPMGS